MATDARTVDVSSFTTDAKFRTWGSAVSASIQAGGLTITTDTGQINWTTVLKATAINTKQGYEIYKFSDTLQSTYPVYIRLDYGSGPYNTSPGNQPGMWLTIGTGTDGAGNITGPTTGTLQMTTGNSTPTGTTCPVKSCSVAGFTYCLAGGAAWSGGVTNSVAAFAISRTCDSSGTLTGDGLYLAYYSGANTWSSWGLSLKTGSTTNTTIACAALSSSSVSTGSVCQLYKHYVLLGVPYYTYGGLTYVTADIASGTTFTAAPWNTTHTYLAVGSAYGSNPWGGDSTNNAAFSPAFLWE